MGSTSTEFPASLPFQIKKKATLKPRNLDCVQFDVNVWIHMHSQEEVRMILSVREYVEIKCSSFLILIEFESVWKTEVGYSSLCCLPKSIEKAFQKHFSS